MEYQNIKLPWPEWKLEKRLGGGSFGEVYEAVKSEYGVDYHAAIKIIHVTNDDDDSGAFSGGTYQADEAEYMLEDMVNDCGKEISTMITLKGLQNVVSVEDFKIEKQKQDNGWDIFIRMELLTPLKKAYKDLYTEADVIQLGCDICTALEYCSYEGIIHRDIKPDNIFVKYLHSGEKIYKLGDFGIARRLEGTTHTMSAKGTYWYMAPEVAHHESYGTTIDTYSLGLVLHFYMNNCRYPFLDQYNKADGSVIDTVLRRRLNREELPEPCNASPELAKVILKACSPFAQERYLSPADMKADLERIRQGKPVKIKAAERGETYGTIKTAESTGTIKVAEPIIQRDVDTGAPQPPKKNGLKYFLIGIVGAALLAGCFAAGMYLSDRPEKETEAQTTAETQPAVIIETQASETQASETQTSETQAPETQAPETQAPETQASIPENADQTQADLGQFYISNDYSKGIAIREQPSADSECLTRIPYGTIFTATARQGEWLETSVNGYHGWISDTCAEPYVPEPMSISQSSLPINRWYWVSNDYSKGIAIRKDPDADSECLIRIPYGTRVYALAAQGEWIKVNYDGYDGWMSTTCLTIE